MRLRISDWNMSRLLDRSNRKRVVAEERAGGDGVDPQQRIVRATKAASTRHRAKRLAAFALNRVAVQVNGRKKGLRCESI
jgi:hypothetical protein